MGKKKGNQSVPDLFKIEVKDEIGKNPHLKLELRSKCYISMQIKRKKNTKFDYFYHFVAESNVLLARDRFRGALRELLHPSDEGSSGESGDDMPANDYRNIPKKMLV